MKKHSAFSLIEISVVILIIGILVAGVAQGSRLIAQMRLASARALTQSSPVPSIADLSLWLETTSEKSLDDADQEDGNFVDNWYDINPQLSTKINFKQTTPTNQPTYKSTLINGLPAIQFNGDDFLTLSTTQKYQDVTGIDQVTIFAVTKATTLSSNVFFVGKSTSDIFRISSHFPFDNNQFVFDFGQCCDAGISRLNGTYLSSYSNRANIIVWQKKSALGIVRANGTQILNSGMTGAFSSSDMDSAITFNLGSAIVSGYYLNGYIAEFIMFRRALKADEISDIEKYLGKKWGIVIN
jgi:prepilin-type N-terminal cleavage/methylation domain-containing protein